MALLQLVAVLALAACSGELSTALKDGALPVDSGADSTSGSELGTGPTDGNPSSDGLPAADQQAGADQGQLADHSLPPGDQGQAPDQGSSPDQGPPIDQGPTPDDGLPPRLSNFRVTSAQPARIYFDSSEPITATTHTGFIVSGESITSLSIQAGKKSGHYFVVSPVLSFWDNNTIRYEGGSDLKDLVGTALPEFTLEYVVNQIPEPDAAPDTHYVSLSGSDNNDGKTEAKAWRTIKKAFDTVTKGTVWIKAGNYGHEEIDLVHNGTPSAPIKFIGYKTTPGDITSNYWNYLNPLDASEMPTLDANDLTNGGRTIKDWGTPNQGIIIKNLQITRSAHATHLIGTKYLVLQRINVDLIGDENSYSVGIQLFPTYKTPFTDANGKPVIESQNMYTKILECKVKNTTGNGIAAWGSQTLFKDNEVYCDRGANDTVSMDYYMSNRGDSCIMLNNKVHRKDGVAHDGYGTSIRTDKGVVFNNPTGANILSRWNLIQNNHNIGLGRPLKARNYGADYNVFKDNLVEGYGAIKDNKNGGISIFGGASHNIWERNIFKNVSLAIQFYNNVESQRDAKVSDGNIIRNNVFYNTFELIQVANVDSTYQLTVKNTKIYNNTFHNTTWSLFRQYSAANKVIWSGNELKNNIFTSCPRVSNGVSYVSLEQAFSTSAYNCYFNVPVPQNSSNHLTVDPGYVNAGSGNFVPQTTTLAGTALPEVNEDYNRKPRLGTPTMGAFQL